MSPNLSKTIEAVDIERSTSQFEVLHEAIDEDNDDVSSNSVEACEMAIHLSKEKSSLSSSFLHYLRQLLKACGILWCKDISLGSVESCLPQKQASTWDLYIFGEWIGAWYRSSAIV
jgi:hypothetical protein